MKDNLKEKDDMSLSQYHPFSLVFLLLQNSYFKLCFLEVIF